MSNAQFVGTMSEWMRDVIRRIEKLERRKKATKTDGGTQVSGVPVGGVIILPAGSHLVDNGDGTYTVVEGS